MAGKLFGLVALCLLVASTAATADIFRCVTDGKITYTDQPCEGGAVIDTGPATPADAAAKLVAVKREDAAFSAAMRNQTLAERAQDARTVYFTELAAATPPVPEVYYLPYAYGYAPYRLHAKQREHPARPPVKPVASAPAPVKGKDR